MKGLCKLPFPLADNREIVREFLLAKVPRGSRYHFPCGQHISCPNLAKINANGDFTGTQILIAEKIRSKGESEYLPD